MQEIKFLNRSKVAELRQSGRKIVGFGAGILGLKTINFLDNPFDYFIDNSYDKVNSGWKEYTQEVVNVPIKHFEAFKEANVNKLAVIICSEHFEHMSKQLLSLNPNILIFYTPLLKNFQVYNRLLNCSNNILISAYGGAGGVYLLNGETKEYRLLKSGSFRGTTLCQGKIYVANEQGDLFRINALEDGEIEMVIEQPQRTNTHGILYWDKLNLMFITETLNDCISVYDVDGFKKVDEISISHKSEIKGGNYHHINDLCLFNDKIYLSAISNSGNFYSDFLDGTIYEIDYNHKISPHVVVEQLLFPHAIQEINGKLLYLNSFSGDVQSISKETIINLPGFVRGMDYSDGLLYIGQSRHRRLDKAQLYFNGVSMDSGVYVVDLNSLTHRFIHMPEMCDIFNIRIIDLDYGITI